MWIVCSHIISHDFHDVLMWNMSNNTMFWCELCVVTRFLMIVTMCWFEMWVIILCVDVKCVQWHIYIYIHMSVATSVFISISISISITITISISISISIPISTTISILLSHECHDVLMWNVSINTMCWCEKGVITSFLMNVTMCWCGIWVIIRCVDVKWMQSHDFSWFLRCVDVEYDS